MISNPRLIFGKAHSNITLLDVVALEILAHPGNLDAKTWEEAIQEALSIAKLYLEVRQTFMQGSTDIVLN